MRNLLLIMICFMTYSLSTNLTAQTTAKHNGRDITISDDGTWRYADELECDFNGKRIIINANGTWTFADDVRKNDRPTKTRPSKSSKDKNKDKSSTANTSNNKKDDDMTKEEPKEEVKEEPEEPKGYSDDDNGEISSKLLTIIDRVNYSGGFGFTVKREDHKVNWSITCTGRGKCTVKNSYIDIVFTDGQKMSFTNREEDNCNYLVAAKMSLKNEREYKKYAYLSTVPIKSMKVKTKSDEVAFDFSESQAKKTMDLFKSVYEVKM